MSSWPEYKFAVQALEKKEASLADGEKKKLWPFQGGLLLCGLEEHGGGECDLHSASRRWRKVASGVRSHGPHAQHFVRLDALDLSSDITAAFLQGKMGFQRRVRRPSSHSPT